jgi:signal transduction histidine kinase
VVEKPVTVTAFREEGDALLWDMETAGDSDFIGTVRIAYSTAGIDKLLSRMKYQFVWLAALLTVFSLLFFSIIARSLVAPLTRLVETIRNVTGGEWTARVTPGNLPETRELSIAFNAMLDSLERSRTALEKADREVFQKRTLAELGKFSLMVAHEVKNPLGIIKSSLDMLVQEESPESRELLTAYMNDEIRRLNRLIEDFLQFARPAAPNFRSVDINAVLSDCLDRFEIRRDEPRVRIRRVIPESSCRIIADPDLLVRAFGNILKNAVEAGGEGGEVDIEAEVRSEGNDRFWCLAIRDRGEGIDPENLERIFEPFFTTRSKGTGLGLAFTAQIVHSHGGEITAENRKNGGAVFRVHLPVGRMRITDAGSSPVDSPAD